MFLVTTSAELLARADLDDLGARGQDGRVPRTDVVASARLRQLLVAARAEADRLGLLESVGGIDRCS